LEVGPSQEGLGGEAHQIEGAACEDGDPPSLGACEGAPSFLGDLLGGQDDGGASWDDWAVDN